MKQLDFEENEKKKKVAFKLQVMLPKGEKLGWAQNAGKQLHRNSITS